jgi:hypothetical protein
MVVFEPITKIQKDFLNYLFFGYFLLVFKKLKIFKFFTACSACVGILLPHAQHA